jgi:hypothetical protein
MKVGLLWYDDTPGCDLAEKVERAARRYRRKFGTAPDACYVHPSALDGSGNGKVRKVGGVHVSSQPSMLLHHFWVGQEEEQQGGQRQRKAN